MGSTRAITLNPEELRLQQIQPKEALPPSSPLSSIPSTIGPISPKEPIASPSRPELPSPNYMYEVLGVAREMEDDKGEEMRLYREQIKTLKAQRDQLEKEKEAKLKEHAAAVQAQNTWSALVNVSQYLLTASSMVLGATLISSGVAVGAGYFLVASGISGMANRAFHDLGVWQSVAAWFTKSVELQLTIANKIETGMFYLSFGLGLAGGIWAYSNGAFALAEAATRDTVIEKATQALGLASGALSAGSRFGKARAEKQINYALASTTELDGILTKINHVQTRQSMNVKQSLEGMAAILEAAKEMIQKYEVHLD